MKLGLGHAREGTLLRIQELARGVFNLGRKASHAADVRKIKVTGKNEDGEMRVIDLIQFRLRASMEVPSNDTDPDGRIGNIGQHTFNWNTDTWDEDAWSVYAESGYGGGGSGGSKAKETTKATEPPPSNSTDDSHGSQGNDKPKETKGISPGKPEQEKTPNTTTNGAVAKTNTTGAVAGTAAAVPAAAEGGGVGSAIWNGLKAAGGVIETGTLVTVAAVGSLLIMTGDSPQFHHEKASTKGDAKADKGAASTDKGEVKTKVPKAGVSGKEGAKDVPSWAKGSRPNVGESGKDFSDRLCGDKYGKGNFDKGPDSEYNKIKKWGDRSFVDPK